MAQRTITYEMAVTITHRMDEDEEEIAYTSRHVTARLERDVIKALQQSKIIDGAIDAECLDFEIKEG